MHTHKGTRNDSRVERREGITFFVTIFFISCKYCSQPFLTSCFHKSVKPHLAYFKCVPRSDEVNANDDVMGCKLVQVHFKYVMIIVIITSAAALPLRNFLPVKVKFSKAIFVGDNICKSNWHFYISPLSLSSRTTKYLHDFMLKNT